MNMSDSIVPDPDLTVADLARIMYREYRLSLLGRGEYVPVEAGKNEASAWLLVASVAIGLLERRLRMRPYKHGRN